AGVDGQPLGLLRREVGRRPHDRARLGEVVGVAAAHGAGDAEVGDLDLALGGDEHVARLDVAVHDAVAVGEVEGGGDVGGDVGGTVGVQPPLGPQDLGQAAPPHVLHDDEVGALEGAPVVD